MRKLSPILKSFDDYLQKWFMTPLISIMPITIHAPIVVFSLKLCILSSSLVFFIFLFFALCCFLHILGYYVALYIVRPRTSSSDCSVLKIVSINKRGNRRSESDLTGFTAF